MASAVDGYDALEQNRAKPFDAMLLDVMMPRLSGVEVLEALRAEGRLEVTPVIMISAATELETVVRCLKSGAEDYLTKPLNPVLLRARLGSVLEKRALRQEVRRQLARQDRVQLVPGRRSRAGLHEPAPGGLKIVTRPRSKRQVSRHAPRSAAASGWRRQWRIRAETVDPGAHLGRIDIEARVEFGVSLGDALSFPCEPALRRRLGFRAGSIGAIAWAWGSVHASNVVLAAGNHQLGAVGRRTSANVRAHSAPVNRAGPANSASERVITCQSAAIAAFSVALGRIAADTFAGSGR